MEIQHKVNQLKHGNVLPANGKIEHLETHMSHVFLSDTHVFKLKKPILHDYLDFTTLEKRKTNCETELKLNQRLASEIYQEVIPLYSDQGQLNLSGNGTTIDWLVKMKRIREENILDNLLKSNTLPTKSIQKPLHRLSEFYNSAAPQIDSEEEYVDRIQKGVEDGMNVVVNNNYHLPLEITDKIGHFLNRFIAENKPIFHDRVKKGKIIEGHGDLRPEHVCIDPPVIFDSLEFNRDFRIIDPVDELAYLSMESEKEGHPDLEKCAFDTYREVTGDDFPENLIQFYKVGRTLLRARLAIKRLIDIPSEKEEKWINKAIDYLTLGEKLIS